jgi:predicted nucleic acid-binding protein
VQLAASASVRARRLRTLRAVQATYVALPIDNDVASAFAQLVASARRAGHRPKVQDAWIAATAHAHAVPLYSQDDDFEALEVQVVLV